MSDPYVYNDWCLKGSLQRECTVIPNEWLIWNASKTLSDVWIRPVWLLAASIGLLDFLNKRSYFGIVLDLFMIYLKTCLSNFKFIYIYKLYIYLFQHLDRECVWLCDCINIPSIYSLYQNNLMSLFSPLERRNWGKITLF